MLSLIHIYVVLGAFLVKKSDALVDGNPVEPGGQFRFSAEIVDIGPCLDEYLLKNVVTVFMRQYHFPDLPVQSFAVFCNKRGESLSLSLGIA